MQSLPIGIDDFKFCFLLSDLYDRYAYLLEVPGFSRAERKYFQRIHDGQGTPVEMEEALRRLMDMMQRYYQQPVVLLLDEYDIPVQQAWEHGFYEDCIAFMRNFLSAALKTNPFLDFAVLTGVLRIAKESIFSGLNNLEVSSVINGSYADWIGFTQPEVTALAAACGKKEALSVLHTWYDGYRFGETDAVQQDNLLRLMQGKSITSVLTENTIYPELADNPDALYTILLLTGYLKIVSRRLVIDTWIYVLAIPNQEV